MTNNDQTSAAQMVWPYADKMIDPGRKIAAATWAILEHSLVPPPSAYGMLPWVFIIVRDPQVRSRLLAPVEGLVDAPDCSHFVVFARNNTMTEAEVLRFVNRDTTGHSAHGTHRVYATAGAAEEARNGARGISVKEWTARQAYVALGDLMTTAALLGLVARPVDGLDPARYDEILGLTAKGFSTVCACALGYLREDLPSGTTAPSFGADEQT